MNAAVKLWRAFPIRGPGRLIVADLQRRAREAEVIAAGPRDVRYHIDPSNPPEVSIYLWGTYEPEVIAALDCLLRPGCTAVDIGANCGVLTVLMRRMAGPDGRVLAVEPSPEACERIRQQSALNQMDGVAVYDVAVGALTHEEPFRKSRVGVGMLPLVDAELTAGQASETQVRTIDDISADVERPPIGLIKIDTDGSEVGILRGSSGVLSRDRPALIIETYIEGLRRRDVGPADLAEILEKHDYELFVPDFGSPAAWSAAPRRPRRFVPTPISRLADGLIDQCNVVAVARGADDAAWLAGWPRRRRSGSGTD